MKDIKLGCLIYGQEQRDAIHVAIAPVTAGVELRPGQHVGLDEDRRATVAGSIYKAIGIVDPFLPSSTVIGPGTKFWLCLYQQTITGMRHHWKHPAFSEVDQLEDSQVDYECIGCGFSD